METLVLSLEELEDNDFTLIAVNTTLEDYRLAYLTNEYLNVTLKKAKNTVDLHTQKGIVNFNLFEFYHKKEMIDWYLISNKFKIKSNSEKSLGLFQEESSFMSSYVYLLPEVKTADFLIKIHTVFEEERTKNLLKIINKIKGVITAFQVDTLTLHNKENLIF